MRAIVSSCCYMFHKSPCDWLSWRNSNTIDCKMKKLPDDKAGGARHCVPWSVSPIPCHWLSHWTRNMIKIQGDKAGGAVVLLCEIS